MAKSKKNSLALAEKFMNLAIDTYGMCCGGEIDREGKYFWFHSDEFSTSYPPDAKEGENATEVETHARFYADGVVFGFVFDNGSYCDVTEYSDKILYPSPITPETLDTFWTAFTVAVGQGAEAAWNQDICSCVCGNHYHAASEASCCSDDDEDFPDDSDDEEAIDSADYRGGDYGLDTGDDDSDSAVV